MIVYLDSSVIVRAYLADEEGHHEAVTLMNDPGVAAITGTWTRVEVSGALVRAVRSGRANGEPDEQGLLALLDADLGIDGPQLDEIRAVQYFYGDPNEKSHNGQGNNTAALATALGSIPVGSSFDVGSSAVGNWPGPSGAGSSVSALADGSWDFGCTSTVGATPSSAMGLPSGVE